MKLTATLAALALTTSTAFAENYPPQVSEKPVAIEKPDDSGGTDMGLAVLVVLLGVILANHRPSPDLNSPRPTVRPQMCMDKQGVFVACGE